MHRLFRWSALVLGLQFAVWTTPSAAQFINQQEVEEVLHMERMELDELPEVYYDYAVLSDPRGNSVIARNTFFKRIGTGDVELGRTRARLVEMLNRVLLEHSEIGDTLVIPSSPEMYELDFRAYAPFPRYYPGARAFDKLFIIHKTVQAYAAYEHGRLVRWGIVNTGAKESPTPTGRYNFNWKEPYRVSSLSPPGEPWEMYWVYNIHDARGIHIHQYAMPTGGPTSHGCVRLIDADAKWIYDWAVPWSNARGTGAGSMGTMPQKQGTTVLVLGEDPVGHPHVFDFKKRYPVLIKVELPADPYDVPAGTPQQEYFDRLRMRASR